MINPDIIFGRLGNNLFQKAYIYGQMKRGEIPDIFVQDPKYFDEYREEIRQLFGSYSKEVLDPLPYIAIHLRVGKNPLNPSEPAYLKNPFYVSLPSTDYYEKALEHFPNERFLVFSDDLDFAQNYFIGEEYEFDETKDEIEALTQMSRCKGHIIANSSFSLWGAYLSPHGGKVVAPKNWYSDGDQNRTKCPSDWVRV